MRSLKYFLVGILFASSTQRISETSLEIRIAQMMILEASRCVLLLVLSTKVRHSPQHLLLDALTVCSIVMPVQCVTSSIHLPRASFPRKPSADHVPCLSPATCVRCLFEGPPFAACHIKCPFVGSLVRRSFVISCHIP